MTNPFPDRDPFFEREAANYDNPVPSREYITLLLEHEGRPLSRRQIAAALQVDDDERIDLLFRRLRAMERDGQLIRNRRGGYGLVDKMDLVRGRVIGHPEGFGFLVPEDGSDDLFLNARDMHAVLHGDRIVARIAGIDRRGRREGAVVEVLERANRFVVGRYFIDAGVGFVIADNKRINQDILVPQEQAANARHGQLVTVELIEQPTLHRQALARVTEIIGDHMAPGMEIDLAIRSHSLPFEWSPALLAELTSIPNEVPEAAKQGRTDLRDLPLVTIDGEDARDFDDAVFAEPSGKGWRLVVAIADVSHYVRPGSALDQEAQLRGNSVYFPGRVVPMLPEALSNGLCSLNPQVDRLCMVCDMRITSAGGLRSYRFYPAVMRSQARLTYTEVAAMLQQQDKKLRRRHAALVPHLEHLYQLYQLLLERRQKRGAIDFDSDETRIVFGPESKIERIVPVQRNDAHRLVEECMLIANTAAAKLLEKAEIPTLYRVHEGPRSEKLADLREFLNELGLKLGGGDKPEAKHYSKLLESIRDREDAHLIQTVLLRSQSQAQYTPDNHGHFGLAYDAYAHFTSPIRRYPDLLVHRAISHLHHGGDATQSGYTHEAMVQLGEHCSMSERRADEATREATDWLKCEFMMDRVGQQFDGIITAVTSFGIFVQLREIYVEGLIHVSALDNDYYHFDPAGHRLVGERSGRSFRLADAVRVRVIRVDLDERKIDFELAPTTPPAKGGRRGSRRS